MTSLHIDSFKTFLFGFIGVTLFGCGSARMNAVSLSLQQNEECNSSSLKVFAEPAACNNNLIDQAQGSGTTETIINISQADADSSRIPVLAKLDSLPNENTTVAPRNLDLRSSIPTAPQNLVIVTPVKSHTLILPDALESSKYLAVDIDDSNRVGPV
jgi:hypothetical protein